MRMRSYFLIAAVLIVIFNTAQANAGPSYGSIEWADVQRNPVLVSASDDAKVVLDNVRWGFVNGDPSKPVWKRTCLKMDRVKGIYFFLKPFPPEWLASHAFLAFEFDDASPLAAQDGKTSKMLVLSVEPKYRKGKTYGTSQTEGPMFIVFQLSTIEDYREVCSTEKARVLFPFRLSFNQKQSRDLLTVSIAAATKNKESDNAYSLLYNNCINNLFILFNSVIGENRKFRKNFFKALFNPRVSTPQLCVGTMKKAGLIAQALPPVYEMGIPETLTGAELERSAEMFRELSSKLNSLKANVFHNIDTGILTRAALKSLLFNADAEYSVWMFVPGAVPGNVSTGEYYVGEEFIRNIDSAADCGELKKAVGDPIEGYRRAVSARMRYKGYSEVYKFLDLNVSRVSDNVQRYVNAACVR